jgi:hypothetical protein
VLKSGGRLVIDVGEFLEQHASLWVADYFPSLVNRYRSSLHSARKYVEWLDEIGFVDVACEKLTYKPTEKDYVLRIGQYEPRRYLNPEIVRAIPAFQDMSASELNSGQRRIEDDIDSGRIGEVIAACRAKAEMEGDVGFILGRRP